MPWLGLALYWGYFVVKGVWEKAKQIEDVEEEYGREPKTKA
jgi:hypothetical protein